MPPYESTLLESSSFIFSGLGLDDLKAIAEASIQVHHFLFSSAHSGHVHALGRQSVGHAKSNASKVVVELPYTVTEYVPALVRHHRTLYLDALSWLIEHETSKTTPAWFGMLHSSRVEHKQPAKCTTVAGLNSSFASIKQSSQFPVQCSWSCLNDCLLAAGRPGAQSRRGALDH